MSKYFLSFQSSIFINFHCFLVLDPRYKDTLFRANSSILKELFSDDWISDCAGALVETCEDYYNQDSHSPDIQPQPPKAQTPDSNDFDALFEASIPQRSPQSLGSASLQKEISEYLSEEVIGEVSPLTWWRNHEARFPRLAAMARDFLCIPGEFQMNTSLSCSNKNL